MSLGNSPWKWWNYLVLPRISHGNHGKSMDIDGSKQILPISRPSPSGSKGGCPAMSSKSRTPTVHQSRAALAQWISKISRSHRKSDVEKEWKRCITSHKIHQRLMAHCPLWCMRTVYVGKHEKSGPTFQTPNQGHAPSIGPEARVSTCGDQLWSEVIRGATSGVGLPYHELG